MIYCIDSHTFIWAIKKQASDHDKYRLKEAEKFLKWVKDEKHQIILPVIVLAECLISESLENQVKILQVAYKTCMVVNFDERCALKYSELLRLDKWNSAKAVIKVNQIRREKMKLDHMILCCALVNGANGIFTEDPEFITFAEPYIKVLPMPKIADQSELYFTEEKQL